MANAGIAIIALRARDILSHASQSSFSQAKPEGGAQISARPGGTAVPHSGQRGPRMATARYSAATVSGSGGGAFCARPLRAWRTHSTMHSTTANMPIAVVRMKTSK